MMLCPLLQQAGRWATERQAGCLLPSNLYQNGNACFCPTQTSNTQF